MIKVEFKGRLLDIPTSYNDLQIDSYAKIANKKPLEKVSILLDCEDLSALRFCDLVQLTTVLFFLDEAPNIEPYDHNREVERSTYGEFLRMKSLLKKSKENLLDILPAILEIFGLKNEEDSLPVQLGKAYGMIELFLEFCDKYKRLNDYVPSEAEALADNEALEKYGDKLTVKFLADRWHIPMSEVFKKSVVDVYEYLLMDFEQSEARKKVEKAQKLLSESK